MPAIGAKECIFNLNIAFLDPTDVALAADPGYPVYTGGPLLAGAEAVLMPLVPELGFIPDLDLPIPRPPTTATSRRRSSRHRARRRSASRSFRSPRATT